MAEALGTVHMYGRGLLRERWWPADPTLVFDQMTAPVPEIMDSNLYLSNSLSTIFSTLVARECRLHCSLETCSQHTSSLWGYTEFTYKNPTNIASWF
jgi:hypothetical protein